MKASRTKVIAVISVVIILSGGTLFALYYLNPPSPNPGRIIMGIYDKLDLSPYNWRAEEHGRIYNRSGLFIMDLNGTYADMGYAHGLLVGQLIKYAVEAMFHNIVGGNGTLYDLCHDQFIRTYFIMNSTYHSEEFNAIRQACVDSAYDMVVPSLGRAWDVLDLWIMNLGNEINLLLGVNTSHCSSYGVFASAALNAKNFIGRNFDYYQDPAGYMTQLNLIIIYRGNGSRNDVISFAYPGFLGIISGFNNKGVWVDSDNSNGKWSENNNRTSQAVAMRNFLEHENSSHVADSAVEYFRNQNALSPFLLLVGSNESSSKPIFVLEGNDFNVVVRNETEPDHDYIAMTTYQMILMPPVSVGHYLTLMWDLGNLTTTEDMKVSPDEGLQMLKDVAWGPTVTSIIFFPSTLEFRVGYCRINVGDGEPWTRGDIVMAPWSSFINSTLDYNDL